MAGESGGGPIGDIPSQMDWIFDEMLGRPFTRFCPVNAWRPAVNLYETPATFVVCVDLSGMQQKDFDVSVQQGMLVIRGTRRRPSPGADGEEFRTHVMEINTGDFYRVVEIPASVRQADIEADYREGLLRITLPKAE